MRSRSLFFGTLFLLGALVLLFGFDLWEALQPGAPQHYLAYNDVRGSAIEHNGKLYTLNFDQQNALVDFLNHALPSAAEVINQPASFTQIVIYRFNKPDVLLTPIGYASGALLFAVPALANNQLLSDSSHGGMQKLLTKTYDP